MSLVRAFFPMLGNAQSMAFRFSLTARQQGCLVDAERVR